ncbi:MAG: iron ABC transporter permease, partial [Devosia sp.]
MNETSMAGPAMARARRLPANAAVLALAAVVATLSLIPLGYIIGVAVSVGWDEVVRLVIRPRILELLLNTFWLELLVLPLAAGLGVALAWITERTNVPGARWWAALMVAPLAIPAFVQSYAWNSILFQLFAKMGLY